MGKSLVTIKLSLTGSAEQFSLTTCTCVWGRRGFLTLLTLEKSHLSKYTMVSLKKLVYIEKEDTAQIFFLATAIKYSAIL